ncbi:MAG: hypothetical protein RRY20_06025 [Bilophila sp.]
MQISGASQLTENGTTQSTEDLLRSGVSPQVAMTNQLINNTLQKQTEQGNIFRASVNHELGMGLQIDTQA